MAPGTIPTVVTYLKEWLPGDEACVKNHSCELSQHSVNYIMPMLKYFSAKARPATTVLAHIFHHLRMLKSITFPDSIMSVEGNEWKLRDPNSGHHSFGTRKGNIYVPECLFYVWL